MSRRRGECGYCGPKSYLPPGWDYIKTRYECLRSGVGVGKFSERRSWQSRLGLRVDPPYVNHCGENRLVDRQLRGRRNLRRFNRSSSEDSDDNDDSDDNQSRRSRRIFKSTKNKNSRNKTKSKLNKIKKSKPKSKPKINKTKKYKSKK
jgi:hypothetical protein